MFSNPSSAAALVELPIERIVSCGDVSCEFLIDPIPRPKPAPFAVVTRPRTRHVQLMDNQKPNALEILQMAQQILRERGIDVADEIPRKIASMPLDPGQLRQYSEERGLLLMGIND